MQRKKYTRVNIDKETLKTLYINKKLSVGEIAEMYGIARSTAYIALKRNGLLEAKKRAESHERKCIWDVFDDEFQKQRQFEQKIKRRTS